MGRAYDVKWWIEKWERLDQKLAWAGGWRCILAIVAQYAVSPLTTVRRVILLFLNQGGPKFALNKGLSNSDNLCMLCPAITGG